MSRSRLTGPVEVVGAGLLGTSVALACRRAGLDVLLSDVAPEHVRTASGLGAGRPRTPEDRPQLVVVAVPPDHLAEVIVDGPGGLGRGRDRRRQREVGAGRGRSPRRRPPRR